MSGELLNVNAILHDLDGSLLEGADGVIIENVRTALSSQGHRYATDYLGEMMRPFWGQRDTEFFPHFIPHATDDQGKDNPAARQAEEARQHYVDSMMREYPNSVIAVEGAAELLVRLRENNIRQALVTGMRPELVDAALEATGLDRDVFDTVITIYDDESLRGKPHPDMAQKAMREIGVNPGETAGIGDSENDMKMYIAAGVIPVAVMTGAMDKAKAKSAGAQLILGEITELQDHLELRVINGV
jgi:HAD superfamily hydrolase (TIGR01509 family)